MRIQLGFVKVIGQIRSLGTSTRESTTSSMTLPVESVHDGMRLDRFLRDRVPRLTQAMLCKLLRTKQIAVVHAPAGGEAAVRTSTSTGIRDDSLPPDPRLRSQASGPLPDPLEISTRVSRGQQLAFPEELYKRLRCEWEESGDGKERFQLNAKMAEELRARVLYEDSDILAINKAYGLAVQGAATAGRAC